MKKTRFHIAVAVVAGILFLAVTVTHACIGTTTRRGAHGCSGFEGSSLLRASHTEAQDENCGSVRDRFVSLASGPSQSHPFAGELYLIPNIREQLVTKLQMLTAERPPGLSCIADDQPPLYIFNSVFRI